jgi:hypothetical protein
MPLRALRFALPSFGGARPQRSCYGTQMSWSVMCSSLRRVARLTFVGALGTLCLGACAAAGQDNPIDEPVADAEVAPDACIDTDGDGACNHLDKCPGADDNVDSDGDTVADGCDDCPGLDDRVDSNANQIPDCSELKTRTINVKLVGTNYWRGWYISTGSHTSNIDNTMTGLNGSEIYNSYFVFTLTGFVAATVQSVTLELEKEFYDGDQNETLSMWDVSVAPSTLEANATNVTTFNDLQAGQSYGTSVVDNAPIVTTPPTIIPLPFNARGIADLKAKVGQDFAVGLHLDTQPGRMRFSFTSEERIARLVIKYL